MTLIQFFCICTYGTILNEWKRKQWGSQDKFRKLTRLCRILDDRWIFIEIQWSASYRHLVSIDAYFIGCSRIRTDVHFSPKTLCKCNKHLSWICDNQNCWNCKCKSLVTLYQQNIKLHVLQPGFEFGDHKLHIDPVQRIGSVRPTELEKYTNLHENKWKYGEWSQYGTRSSIINTISKHMEDCKSIYERWDMVSLF